MESANGEVFSKSSEKEREGEYFIIVIIQIVILLIIQIAVMAGTSSHMCWALLVLLSISPFNSGGHSLTQNSGTEKETETPGHRKGAERGDLGQEGVRRWPQCPPVS